MTSTRRTFLASATTAVGAACAVSAPAKISGITLAAIQGNFHKFVAMNSYDNEPKGTQYTNTLVRLSTDVGVEGVGVMGYARPTAAFLADIRSLIGVSPEALYEFRDGRIAGRSQQFADLLVKYKHLDGPLCDLIGKLRGVPCWKLFGDSVRDRVEVYDGTLYFSDLWYRDRGVQAVVEEAQEAVRSGYRGIKLKIGRGSKWMQRDEGLRRDIEIIQAVRDAIGMSPKLLVDANNGFRNDYEGAWQLLESTKHQRLTGWRKCSLRTGSSTAACAETWNAREFALQSRTERTCGARQTSGRTSSRNGCSMSCNSTFAPAES